MPLKVYTELEWFEKYYPKGWGDFRKFFNIRMQRKHPNATGCSWLDYSVLGYCCSEKDGKLDVVQLSEGIPYFKGFLECGTLAAEKDVHYFIQPTLQHSDGMYFAMVEASKQESNLDLYFLRVSGADDASYSKHFIGEAALKQGIADLLAYGIGITQEPDQGYFFTN